MELAQHPDFIHHEWFVQYHLSIVEKIALELCECYAEAERNLVLTLVWLHDYGKIIGAANPNAATLSSGKIKLEEFGFSSAFIAKAITCAEQIDKKVGLERDTTPIEVKILSSADAAAHLVGPFFHLWWHENPEKPFEVLMQDNLQKARKDWDKKWCCRRCGRHFGRGTPS